MPVFYLFHICWRIIRFLFWMKIFQEDLISKTFYFINNNHIQVLAQRSYNFFTIRKVFKSYAIVFKVGY